MRFDPWPDKTRPTGTVAQHPSTSRSPFDFRCEFFSDELVLQRTWSEMVIGKRGPVVGVGGIARAVENQLPSSSRAKYFSGSNAMPLPIMNSCQRREVNTSREKWHVVFFGLQRAVVLWLAWLPKLGAPLELRRA